MTEIPTNSVRNVVYKATITNMEMVRDFEVMSDKYNVDGNCTSGVGKVLVISYSQKQNTIIIMIITTTTTTITTCIYNCKQYKILTQLRFDSMTPLLKSSALQPMT
jgi:hypothetical protein